MDQPEQKVIKQLPDTRRSGVPLPLVAAMVGLAAMMGMFIFVVPTVVTQVNRMGGFKDEKAATRVYYNPLENPKVVSRTRKYFTAEDVGKLFYVTVPRGTTHCTGQYTAEKGWQALSVNNEMAFADRHGGLYNNPVAIDQTDNRDFFYVQRAPVMFEYFVVPEGKLCTYKAPA